MRTVLTFALALTACGSSSPNQANYDRIQAEAAPAYAGAHGADAGHADGGTAGGAADHGSTAGGDHGATTGDHGGQADGGAAAGADAHADGAEGAPATHGDPVRGKEVFGQYCVACHGADGKGMGGLAANFVEDKSRLAKPDAELVKSVREGYTGKLGVMPPWGAVVSEPDAYAAIAYIRQEFGGE